VCVVLGDAMAKKIWGSDVVVTCSVHTLYHSGPEPHHLGIWHILTATQQN
jgi:hypothetical protein